MKDYLSQCKTTFIQQCELSIEETEDIFEIYQKSTSEIINELNNAINLNNILVIKHNAHTLKGTSSSLFIQSMYELAKELEKSAVRSDFVRCKALLNDIEILFKAIYI